MSEKKLSRRSFLATGTGAAAAGLMSASAGGAADSAKGSTSRVVLIRNPKVLGGDNGANPGIIHEMLNQAVAALMDEPPLVWD